MKFLFSRCNRQHNLSSSPFRTHRARSSCSCRPRCHSTQQTLRRVSPCQSYTRARRSRSEQPGRTRKRLSQFKARSCSGRSSTYASAEAIGVASGFLSELVNFDNGLLLAACQGSEQPFLTDSSRAQSVAVVVEQRTIALR